MDYITQIYTYRRTDKIQEIVKKLYNKDSNPECREYLLIKFLRETCDSSQENIVSLKSLIENLMCLAILKGNINSYKYKTYKRLAYILTIIYGDVGLPPNIRDIFYWPSRFTTGMKNEIIHNLAHSINDRNISNYWQRCKLWRLEGVGKKSIINIIHWKLYGTLPELKNIELKKENTDNDTRNSQKDLLIKQLQDSVKRLVEDNRSLRGSEEIEECSICLDSEGTLVPSKCGHKFHTECLVKWLENKNTCPNCRINLVD
jgi:hypothetical protein